MTIPNEKMSKIGYSSYTKSCTFWRFTIVIALCLISTYLAMILKQSHHELVLTETEEVPVSKGYPAMILDEYVINANFTLEHCGCQRYLKGIVIPFVEMQVLR